MTTTNTQTVIAAFEAQIVMPKQVLAGLKLQTRATGMWDSHQPGGHQGGRRYLPAAASRAAAA